MSLNLSWMIVRKVIVAVVAPKGSAGLFGSGPAPVPPFGMPPPMSFASKPRVTISAERLKASVVEPSVAGVAGLLSALSVEV